ncbi:MAG: 2-amino-4-hydroxy-6-hydroxymethyldihydropteridine diphosphokinase [Armatimonadota bacterium]
MSVLLKDSYLSLGSNIEDKVSNINNAIKLIDTLETTNVIKTSSLYETKPVGFLDQPDFINAVIHIKTMLEPVELLEKLLEIEQNLGRVRTIRYGPRVIDIDILTYNNIKIKSDKLIVPHPEILNRAFILVPFEEIAPEVEIYPGITVRDANKNVDKQNIIRVLDK